MVWRGGAMQVGVGMRWYALVCVGVYMLGNWNANCTLWKVVLAGGCAYQDCGGRA